MSHDRPAPRYPARPTITRPDTTPMPATFRDQVRAARDAHAQDPQPEDPDQ